MEAPIRKISGLADSLDDPKVCGPTADFHIRQAVAARYGLTNESTADVVGSAFPGKLSSFVRCGNQVVDIGIISDPASVDRLSKSGDLLLRTPMCTLVILEQVDFLQRRLDVVELSRQNLRQDDVVSARLQKVDLGTSMSEVKTVLSQDSCLPPSPVEYCGHYALQQVSFRNPLVVLLATILLVLTVLVVEFCSFHDPLAIVIGALPALLGLMLGFLDRKHHPRQRLLPRRS